MEGFQSQYSMPQVDSKPKIDEKIDYSNLPCPVPYEELNREATMALKLDTFEGFRFDYVKTLNQKFGLSHGVSMGLNELPPELFRVAPTDIIKTPFSNYEFGAQFLDPKLLLVGRIMTDGRLNGRLKYDFTHNLSIKSDLQLTNEQDTTHANVTFDYKGSDYRTQVQLGSDSYYKANYIQHVTPQLSLGGDIFYVKNPEKRSGVGFGARYENEKMVASAKVYSTGVAFMDYVHKVSEKLSFAADFMYTHALKDVTASVGYDYISRECRLRGKIDSNGVVAVHLDERLSHGLSILLSAEVDHVKKDYKFGLGFNISL